MRLLLVGTLVNKLGTFIVPYLTLVLLRDFHMAEGEVALLLFAYGAGSVVSILAGGVLTDRLGRRRTLLLSLLGSGVLAVVMGLLPSPRFFVPLLVAFGFIADLYRPAASAVIGDLLPSSERATGFAGLRMAVNLGWASGHGARRAARGLGLAAAVPRRRAHDARLRRPRLLHDPRDAATSPSVPLAPLRRGTPAAPAPRAARRAPPGGAGRRARSATPCSSSRWP